MTDYNDAIKQWMSDWADQFDQSWDDDKLAAFCGMTVDLQRPANEEAGREAKVFTFQVVGWSRDRLQDGTGEISVSKWSLLTDGGNQIALYAGSTVDVVGLSEESDQ